MARRASLPSLVAVSITFYVVLVTTLFFAIVHRTGGTFVYALDDPYIHLAMAEQIAHGHYGINPLEASSPSSSILWPLLLTPLSGSPLQAYLPLAWNLIFGLVSGGLIGVFVERLPGFGKGESPRMLWLQKVAIAVLLIFVANLASLTFLGMEHVLQIMLAICCAIAMVDALQGRSIPIWCLAAAVIGPSVRYENLALTVAIAIALAGLRQTRKAVVVLALAVTPLIAFGIFLRARGLPMLPISVLMKRSANVNPMAPDLGAVRTFLYNLSQDVRMAERGSLVLLLVILIAIFLRDRVRMHRFVLAGTAVVAVAQLVVGKFGWFHRYQVYALIFVSMVLLRLAMEDRKVRFMHVAAVLFFCAAPFLRGTSLTPLAAAEVFEQQYQMHRFEAEF